MRSGSLIRFWPSLGRAASACVGRLAPLPAAMEAFPGRSLSVMASNAAVRTSRAPARLGFASKAGSHSSMLVFDTNQKREQRLWAARQPGGGIRGDYLREYVAVALADRLKVLRHEFPRMVEIGNSVAMAEALLNAAKPTEIAGIKQITLVDNHQELVDRRRADLMQALAQSTSGVASIDGKVVNLEDPDLEPESADIIMSCLSMHWVNDLPGLLRRIRRTLRPDGVFLAAMLGGSTLQELRSAFAVADMERRGGVSPHISPMVGARDMGDLLSGAGFAMPTVDQESFTVEYPDLFTLAHQLSVMGESGAPMEKHAVSRDVFLAAAAVFEHMYKDAASKMVPVTFQIIFMIGWSPAPTQPKPLQRGTAQKSLKDLPEELARAEQEEESQAGAAAGQDQESQAPTTEWDPSSAEAASKQ